MSLWIRGFHINKPFANVINELSLAQHLCEAAIRVLAVAVRQPLLLAVLGQVHDQEGHILSSQELPADVPGLPM